MIGIIFTVGRNSLITAGSSFALAYTGAQRTLLSTGLAFKNLHLWPRELLPRLMTPNTTSFSLRAARIKVTIPADFFQCLWLCTRIPGMKVRPFRKE